MANAAQLKISPELAEKIRAHGAQTYPHECCGALLGRDTEVAERRVYREIRALHPLINRRDDSPNNRFSVTSQDVLDAEKAAGQQGLEVVGWYHSHPDHPARPSQYDRDHAWPWYSYIIVSVANGIPEEMTSWRLAEDRSEFECEEIGLQQVAF
jgi:proteasome lid subunit RPN8/RPN11